MIMEHVCMFAFGRFVWCQMGGDLLLLWGVVAGLIQWEMPYDLPEILLGNEMTLQRIVAGGKAVLKALQVNHQTFSLRFFFLFLFKILSRKWKWKSLSNVLALGLVSFICSPAPRTNTPVCVIRVAAWWNIYITKAWRKLFSFAQICLILCSDTSQHRCNALDLLGQMNGNAFKLKWSSGV